MSSTDTAFSGPVPANYDRYLGPILFEPYARLTAERARALLPRRILETASGTGILTAELHRTLPEAEIVATDLNEGMLEVAARKIRSDKVRFCHADAQDLPFDDGAFDLVLCQFGAMFYPDKVKGHSEARRVLREGGRYLALLWDHLERNPVSYALGEAVAAEFPENPPTFMERAPFSYSDPHRIHNDFRSAGFEDVRIEAVEASSRVSAADMAADMCRGSPMAAEISEHGPDAVERAARTAEAALAPFDGKQAPMSALFVTATK